MQQRSSKWHSVILIHIVSRALVGSQMPFDDLSSTVRNDPLNISFDRSRLVVPTMQLITGSCKKCDWNEAMTALMTAETLRWS
jgi:hypothetical protein